MRRTSTIALIALMTAIVAAPAQARGFSARALSDPHVGTSKQELRAQIAFSGYVVGHFKQREHRWKLLPRHATCWSHVPSVKLRHVCDYARSKLIAHRWLLGLAQTRFVRLYAPKPTPVAAPVFSAGHVSLWRCIAGYPGARSDGTTGESGGYTGASNGSHFNILQMTDPWYGINPIGMSADAIMAKAEQEYARSGYSHVWLYGQWGATVGNCMGYA